MVSAHLFHLRKKGVVQLVGKTPDGAYHYKLAFHPPENWRKRPAWATRRATLTIPGRGKIGLVKPNLPVLADLELRVRRVEEFDAAYQRVHLAAEERTTEPPEPKNWSDVLKGSASTVADFIAPAPTAPPPAPLETKATKRTRLADAALQLATLIEEWDDEPNLAEIPTAELLAELGRRTK
jgi:hypothetical protein